MHTHKTVTAENLAPPQVPTSSTARFLGFLYREGEPRGRGRYDATCTHAACIQGMLHWDTWLEEFIKVSKSAWEVGLVGYPSKCVFIFYR